MEREGKKVREQGQEKKRARVREGIGSPFHSESGTHGHCQVTMGLSLDKMPTLAAVPSTSLSSLRLLQRLGTCLF